MHVESEDFLDHPADEVYPLVRDDLPAFLRPVSFPGLPGDIDDRTLVEEVVARVNGRVLTRSAFVERLEGRHLQLMLEQAPDLERRLELIVSETLAQVVEDEGPGLSEEALEHAFDPFYSTKREGTGLGLSIAFQIVDQQGGDLRVENRPEGGARFTLELPEEASAGAATDAALPARASS